MTASHTPANKQKTQISQSDELNQHDEYTPLLGNAADTTQKSRKWSNLSVLLLTVAMCVMLNFGDQLAESPTTRIMESVSCYRYYERVDPSKLLRDSDHAGPGAIYGVKEMWCKTDTIQAEVATIRSYQLFFDSLPTLVLAIPLGWLQDKYGRRPFIIIGTFSCLFKTLWIPAVLWFWQNFDLRWTWFSSIHALAMGGSPGVTALFFAIISDVISPENRASGFLRCGAALLAAGLLGPPLSSWLMSYNAWLPVFIGTFFTILGTFASILIPETLGYQGLDKSAEDNVAVEASDLPIPVDPVPLNVIRRLLLDVHEATSFLWTDLRLPALVIPYFSHFLMASITSLLVQYCSKRYDLTIASSTLVVTIRAGANTIVLFTVLPYISDLLLKRFGFSSRYKDLWLTRVSLGLATIGWIFVGLSPTTWMFGISLAISSLGTGAMVTLRSFITALVPPNYVARMYSIICMVDTIGMMFGAPILAKFFEAGMRIGGLAVGLPFILLGGASLTFFILMLLIRDRDEKLGNETTDDL